MHFDEVVLPRELDDIFQLHHINHIDYVIMSCPLALRDSDYDVHLQAARQTIDTIDARHVEHIERVYRERPEMRPADGRIYRLTNEWERAKGEAISIDEFLGPCFDRQAKEFRYLGAGMVKVTESGTVLGVGTGPVPPDDRSVHAYADAVLCAPHGSSLKEYEWAPTFMKIGNLLFNGYRDGLEIYRWSTDWSNYFDAGHEWWGAFLWTVYNPISEQIIGVGASTTD